METALITVGYSMIIGGFLDSILIENRSELHIIISMIVKIVGLAIIIRDGGE